MSLHTALKAVEAEVENIYRENVRLRLEMSKLQERKSNRPKLSQRDVVEVRKAYRNGMSQADLARTYEVNPATISRLVRGIYHR